MASANLKPEPVVPFGEEKMSIAQLRREYHQRVCEEIIRIQRDGETEYPNFADRGNRASRAIAHGIVNRLGCSPNYEKLSGQTAREDFSRQSPKTFLSRLSRFWNICAPENGITPLSRQFPSLTSTSIWQIWKR